MESTVFNIQIVPMVERKRVEQLTPAEGEESKAFDAAVARLNKEVKPGGQVRIKGGSHYRIALATALGTGWTVKPAAEGALTVKRLA